MNEHRLKRQIERIKKRIQDYEERKEKLSVHGYWDLGYYQGKLVAMEDWLDSILEINNESEELSKAELFKED